ncbi:MAG TPA: ACT domain-containing protein [Actinomycetota bacterium]|nr:ACT domain-containing protein [Actinomycetota bacterium]
MLTDILVSLEDRPGELARVGEALGDAGINIEGAMGFAHEGRGFAHILVADAAGARRTLEAAGLKVEGETEPLIMDVGEDVDTPGTLGQKARAAAQAGINLRFLYLATRDRAVVGVDDPDAAKKALGL